MTTINFPANLSTASDRLTTLWGTGNHAYKNTTEYPSSSKYHEEMNTELEKFVGTKAEHKEFEKTIKDVYSKRLMEDKAAYNKITSELEAQFRKDLEEEFGVINHPKASKLFSTAWNYGHSTGYAEVYNYYSSLVDLIKGE